PLWKSNFNDMFKKHVMKRALKAQFGVDIDDHTIEGARESVQENAREVQRREINVDENEAVSEEDLRVGILNEIDQLLKEKKMSDYEIDELSKKQFNRVMEKLNIQELTGLKRIVELQPVKQEKPKQKHEEVVEAEFTEVPKEDNKPSAEEINFDDIDFNDIQGEIPFE